jgi:quercetin dioxygenase-like cupin family protein
MNKHVFGNFDHIPEKEIAPGFLSKLIHTNSNTINFITVKAGSSIPLHRHMHEQYSFVLEGAFEMTIEGDTQVLTPGWYCLIPGHAEHGGSALTDCRLVDVFNPVREDYK